MMIVMARLGANYRQSVPTWLRSVVGILLVALCGAWALNAEEAKQALHEVSPWLVASILTMQVAYVVIDAYRYFVGMPQTYRSRMLFWQWTSVFANGRLLNSAIPQSGAVYRAINMRRRWNIPVQTFFVSLVAITWFGNGILLLILGPLLALTGQARPWLALLYGAVGVAVLVGLSSLARMGKKQNMGVASSDLHAGGWRSRVWGAIMELQLAPVDKVRVVVVSVGVQVVGVVIHWLTLASLGVSDAPIRAIALYAASTVTTFISFTPAGLGVTELMAALVGPALAIPASVAILVVFIVRLTGVFGVGGLAAILLLKRPSDRGRQPEISSVRDP